MKVEKYLAQTQNAWADFYVCSANDEITHIDKSLRGMKKFFRDIYIKKIKKDTCYTDF